MPVDIRKNTSWPKSEEKVLRRYERKAKKHGGFSALVRKALEFFFQHHD